MTPQQKADELVERFWDNPQINIRNSEAIQCAIICVEEILKLDTCWYSKQLSESDPLEFPETATEEYWQSVLNELKSRL